MCVLGLRGWYALFAVTAAPWLAVAAEPEAKALHAKTVAKGLQWLAGRQEPDGAWSENGSYPTTMTALAGMAFLMEGSNPREGKYSGQVAKAVDYLAARQEPNGLIGNPRNPTESSRSMYGHGYSMLFLASVVGDEESLLRRRVLMAVLAKAVKFTENAQTSQGGWGYVSAKDGSDYDQGNTLVMQLQGLRACQNAGIAVPKAVIEKAMRYYRNTTTERGGLAYCYQHAVPPAGTERPAVTATALASAASLNRLNDEDPKRWAKFCRDTVYLRSGRNMHDEFQDYYFAQAMYAMGDTQYGKMHPNDDPRTWMTWSAFKAKAFESLRSRQHANGSWSGGYAGPVFATSTALAILQLENAVLPIYSR
jgi:hypothetical protein